jgi:hypothetical protein
VFGFVPNHIVIARENLLFGELEKRTIEVIAYLHCITKTLSVNTRSIDGGGGKSLVPIENDNLPIIVLK